MIARRGLGNVIAPVNSPQLGVFVQQLLARQTLATFCTQAGPEFDLTDALVLLVQNDLISDITQGRLK